METWWQISGYGEITIDPVEVERSTDKFVWIKGRRRAKQSDGFYQRSVRGNYYATAAEAWQALEAEYKKRLARAQKELTNTMRVYQFAQTRRSMLGVQPITEE